MIFIDQETVASWINSKDTVERHNAKQWLHFIVIQVEKYDRGPPAEGVTPRPHTKKLNSKRVKRPSFYY